MKWSSALVAVTTVLALTVIGLCPTATSEQLRYVLLGGVGAAAVVAYLLAP